MNLREKLVKYLETPEAESQISNIPKEDFTKIFDVCQDYYKANHFEIQGIYFKVANLLHEWGFLEKRGVPLWKDDSFVGTNYYFKKVENPIFAQGAYTGVKKPKHNK
jgi:hypothetical protein